MNWSPRNGMGVRHRGAYWLLAGLLGGVLSALVKSGVESLLPPRLPGVIAPTVQVLENLGWNVQAMVYTFSGQTVHWGGNGVHILFSVVMAVLYCYLAKHVRSVTVGHGLWFGWLMAFGAHGLVLPLMGVGPEFWAMPLQGVVSEVVGTTLWMWTIECVRREFVTRY